MEKQQGLRQPWKTSYPHNVKNSGPFLEHERYPYAAGSGKGATPYQNSMANGLQVMRLDDISDFLDTLENSPNAREW